MKIDTDRMNQWKKEVSSKLRHAKFKKLPFGERFPVFKRIGEGIARSKTATKLRQWAAFIKALELTKKGTRYFRLFVSGCVFLAFVLLYVICGAADFDIQQYKLPRFGMMLSAVVFFTYVVLEILSRLKPNTHRGMTVISLMASMLKYVSALVVLCWGLSILGVDVATIVTSMGILALIIGFGAESLIADVVTGVFMLFENQYNVGDIVEVGGFRGTVHEIGVRTTSIMDIGGNIKIINNSEMKNILNRSDNSSVAVSDIGIPYETDLPAFEEKLPELMREIYSRNTGMMKAQPVYAGVQSLDASAITLRFTVETAEKDIYATARIMNRELLLGFRALGVECPYQQIDLHTK